MKKVYVTKYALTTGVEVGEAENVTRYFTFVRRTNGYKTSCIAGKDCFDTEVEAYERVLVLATAKRRSKISSGSRILGLTHWRTEMTKTICMDFDGVLHSYSSGWKGACEIPYPPVPGAFDWLTAAVRRFEVCVYSSRSKEPGAIEAMRAWFSAYGLPAETLTMLEFPAQKPAAFMTIDDRAICFDGTWPSLESIDAFVPWNKR